MSGKRFRHHPSGSELRRARVLPGFPPLFAVVLCALLCLPIPAAAADTSLTVHSDAGDFIGQGRDYFFTPSDGSFSASKNSNQGVSISFGGSGHWWSLNFAAPNSQPLAVGVYSGATRYPFQAPTAPGLSVTGEGRGCNALTGSFQLLEVEYGTGTQIISFRATFEQHCEGSPPALTGEIRFNADVPPTTETRLVSSQNPSLVGSAVTLTATVVSGSGTPTGTVRFFDGGAELGAGTLSGSPATAALTTSGLSLGSYPIVAVYEGDGVLPGSTSPSLIQVVMDSHPTYLMMDSEAGDYVGSGAFHFFTPEDGEFTAHRNVREGVTVSYGVSWQRWDLDFAAPNNQPLAVGTYAGAMPFGFSFANLPGLSVAGEGRSCGTIMASSGSFEIKQVEYAGYDVVSFWATFEHRCASGAPTLRGEIRFNVAGDPSTMTRLTSSSNPLPLGGDVTLTATVGSGGVTPTGTLRFLDGGVELGTATLSGDPASATLLISGLSRGTHALTAAYDGVGDLLGSTSPVLSQRVVGTATGLTLQANLPAVSHRDSVVLSAQLAGACTNREVSLYATPYGGTKELVVTLTVDGAGELAVPVVLTRNTTFVAEYAGDALCEAAASAPVAVGVHAMVVGKMVKGYRTSGRYRLYHRSLKKVFYQAAVTPYHAGGTVNITLDVQQNRKWRYLGPQTFTLQPDSVARIFLKVSKWPIGTRGRFRTFFLDAPDNLGNVSRYSYFQVTR